MSVDGWAFGDGRVSEDRVSRDGWECAVVVSWDGLGCEDVVCLDDCEDRVSLHG